MADYENVIDVNISEVKHYDNNCYSSPQGKLYGISSNMDFPTRSPYRLFENDVELLVPNAMHADISTVGAGRYSHWNGTLFFSSSDNTDPRTNGRSYKLVKIDKAALNSRIIRCSAHARSVCKECKLGITSFPPNCDIEEFNVERKEGTNMSLNDLANYYQTDKGSNDHNYMDTYEHYLKQYKNRGINLLELGIARGSSLKVWADYFPDSRVYGIDINSKCSTLCKNYKSISLHIGDACDNEFLSLSFGNKKFDVIIDDASHLVPFIIKSFNNLWERVAKDGIYIIEDLQCSYSTTYKMVFNYCRSENMTDEEWLKYNDRSFINEWLVSLIKKVDVGENNDIEYVHIYKNLIIIKKL